MHIAEVVYWNVAQEVMSISPSQMHELEAIVTSYRNPSGCELETIAHPTPAGFTTARPTRPLNGRQVSKVCPSS